MLKCSMYCDLLYSTYIYIYVCVCILNDVYILFRFSKPPRNSFQNSLRGTNAFAALPTERCGPTQSAALKNAKLGLNAAYSIFLELAVVGPKPPSQARNRTLREKFVRTVFGCIWTVFCNPFGALQKRMSHVYQLTTGLGKKP